MSARPAGRVGHLGPRRPLKVVSLGGGHGLAASLSALRRLPTDLTGVVTVADNGGSSGRLRDELGILPPGDLRMALAALCGDDDWGRTWADVLQHRFSSEGELHGHAVGNLLIAAVWDRLGGVVEGLDLVGELLGAQGRVLPMAAVPLEITADVRLRSDPHGIVKVRGQVEVASVDNQVVGVQLEPQDPPACPEAVEAILEADWVVIGPGSWFTSVIPNLLVPGIRDALEHTSAKRLLVLNLVEQEGETAGFTPETHLEVLAAHAPELTLDAVLVDSDAVHRDPARVPGPGRQDDPARVPGPGRHSGNAAETPSEVVDPRGSLTQTARSLGAELFEAPVANGPGSDQHDPLRLAAAFQRIFRSVS